METNWPLVQLDDAVECILDRRGVTPTKLGSHFTDSGHRVISAKVVKNGTIDLSADEARYVDDATYLKWMQTPLAAGDVILTSEAPLGEVAYLRNEPGWCLGQRLFAIRSRRDILDGRFLFYAMQSPAVQHDLLSRASGTTVHGIRQSELRKVSVPLPQLSQQRLIAGVLGALDDKIALNRKLASTLEAVARALFNSWFINFDPVRERAEKGEPNLLQRAKDREVPAEWRLGRLGEVAQNIRRGISHADIVDGTPYIGLEHMPRRSIALDRWDHAFGLESNKFEFRDGDFLFGKLRPYFHKIGVAPVSGVCSTDILVISAATADWSAFVLMHLSSDALIAHTDKCSTGTKMPRASWEHISDYEVALPPLPVARAFNNIVAPMMERIVASIHESHTLKALRDALLPRLLSGQIDITDAQSEQEKSA